VNVSNSPLAWFVILFSIGVAAEVALFVVLVWRYKRKSTVLRGILVIAALLAILATPFVAFSVPVALDAAREHRSRIAFDTTVWKASLTKRGDTTRIRMIEDLLRRHHLVGMTQDEVIGLLGKPPTPSSRPDYQLVYWLGPQRQFMGLDSELLAIRVGPDQRVVDARIVSD
jgi:hypothetical protein